MCRMGLAIAESLKGDRRRQVEESGKEVETLLGFDSPLHREYWHQLKGWYWAAVDRSLPPARVTFERITAEWVDFYNYVPPLGANISISVEPFLVDDLVPTEDEIEWVVKRLQNHRSRGPSGMWAEHLKGWIAAAKRKEREEAATEKEHLAEERKMEGTDGPGWEETAAKQ